MIKIERGTTPDITVTVDGLTHSDISSLEAVFKASDSESATALVSKSYPSGGISYDSTNHVYVMSLSESDTRSLPAGQVAFLEIRVVTVGNKIPKIQKEQVRVVPTMIGARA